MGQDEVMNAVAALIALDDRDTARRAAERLPDDLPVADLLRAADGAQRLARALASARGGITTDSGPASPVTRSTYS